MGGLAGLRSACRLGRPRRLPRLGRASIWAGLVPPAPGPRVRLVRPGAARAWAARSALVGRATLPDCRRAWGACVQTPALGRWAE